MADCQKNQLECAKEVGKYIVTECVWPPAKRHIDYWRCFGDNIEGLREEIRYLELERINRDQKIEDARLRAERPTEDIKNWSKDCTQKLEEATGILQGCDDLKAWNICSRYTVGKNAKKTAAGLEKLRSDGNLIRIADPVPPPAMVSLSHESTMEFESRRRIEEGIMECLKDNQVNMIAICGPGGVGKTTMVQRIVRKDNLFDEVVMVVVSQQIDMLKIQEEVAESLALNLVEKTLGARASKLHTRLMDPKRKLIIFDDVWEKLKLEEIGVPFGNCSTSCKIILTSRVKDACEKMNSQKIIPLEVLNEEEAWTLFKEKAGSCVEGLDLRPIAKDVAAECKGLPVALVTVGEALKDRSIRTWRDTLSQLRRSIPTDFPEVIKEVYKPLKLSYDFLEDDSQKDLFLLCCLFPEDYNIPIELLTRYGFGLGIFEEIENIEEGRNRTYNSVERLKSRFLLMNSWKEDHVKMHDVVRDVAIFIGSKEKKGFLKSRKVSSMDSSSKDSFHHCNWMSADISLENTKLSFGSDFPNLRLLMMWSSSSYDKSSQVLDANVINFKGIEELIVLSLSGINLGSLPPTLGLLKKLRTLHLYDSWVKDISVVGELANLEILCIQDCDYVLELPGNIRTLNHLRFLELSNCEQLERIEFGVISSLIVLEELKICCKGIKWEATEIQSEERNASLSELRYLHKLTSLEIYISDSNLVAQEIHLPQKLERCKIYSPRGPSYFSFHMHIEMHIERNIALYLPRDIVVRNWIYRLLRSTQSLELKGDGLNNFNLAETESVKRLTIRQSSTVKKLVNALDRTTFLPMLEHLELSFLKELESIIDGTIPEGFNSFQNLESLIVKSLPKLGYLWKSLNQNILLCNLTCIHIACCNNLRYLFSMATARSLVQLQHLEIKYCSSIEQVFWNGMESITDASIIELPKLQEIILWNMPNLAAFSQGVEIMELPQLTKLQITRCPKLITKIGKSPNLITLYLLHFKSFQCLLSSCCVRKWNIQLQTVAIRNSDVVEEIFWHEVGDDGDRHIIFPALTVLELRNLRCLTTFYKGVESIKFPKLEKLTIGDLPRLNSLLPMDSEATHDHHCIHFFCNQKVEFLGLKQLSLFKLSDTINKIWCRHVPINSFHNLETLDIDFVVGIRNLMSSSIAKNLVNLHKLWIRMCEQMVVVIEDEKEVLVTSLFPNLTHLTIDSLPKLISFCNKKNAFKLPSLQGVQIYDCPRMETFTLGSVSAPNLSLFKINHKHIEGKGLNDGIHDEFVKKIQDDDDEDDENECEDDEDDENEDEDEERSISLRMRKMQRIE